MSNRRDIVTAQAVTNLDQMIDYLTDLCTRLPQALRTDDDVRLLFDCLGSGPLAWPAWDILRRLVSPAHADGFVLDVVLSLMAQLHNMRESLKQPLFGQSREIVDRSVMLGGTAHVVILRLCILIGVGTFDSEFHLLRLQLDHARRGKDQALFDSCLNQIEALFARHRPQWDTESLIKVDQAVFEATVSGTNEPNWPTDLVFLLTLWGGEDVTHKEEPLRALGFYERALRKGERSILREPAHADGVRQALESALYSAKEDALRAAQQGLSRVGAIVFYC